MKLKTAVTLDQHRLAAENRSLRAQLKDALDRQLGDDDFRALLAGAVRLRPQPPAWTRPRRAAKRHEVIPVAPFSDWHLDEVVNPAEVLHLNGYNRAIALRRLQLYFENIIKVARDYVHGFTYPGLVMPWMGDNFSGNIHDELRCSNADRLLSSILFWIEPVVAGLRLLAEEFGHVSVPVVVGNHGRNSLKPIFKGRVRDNFDWLFAHLCRQQLERMGEKRITWQISEAQKFTFPVADLKIMLSHGDEARGGSGIAGMLSPLLIHHARQKKKFAFDLWVLGHWHHRSAFRGIRVNGTGKGYDELAHVNDWDFQVPMQDFFLVAPGMGVIADWPIFVKAPHEGWERKG